MSPPVLRLDDAAHWTDLSGALDEAVGRSLMDGASGIAISAPSAIPLGARDTAPLWGLRVCSFQDAMRKPLFSAVLIGSCVETGELKTARLADPPESVPDDGEDPGEGSTGISFQVDLLERLSIAAKPGTWIIRVILFGEQSNAVTVELKASPTRFVDPAALELVRALFNKPVMRALHPRPALGPGLPSYEPAPENPPVPEQPGIALSIPRAILHEAKMQLVIRGSFRARILPRDVRPPPTQDTVKMRGPRATAVLPITLLALASDGASPTFSPLVVPTYAELEAQGDDKIGTGSFAFDFHALSAVEARAHTIFFYALAGELFSAAAPCAVVTQDQLLG